MAYSQLNPLFAEPIPSSPALDKVKLFQNYTFSTLNSLYKRILFQYFLVHALRREYASETEGDRSDHERGSRKMADAPKKIEGIGPITKDGMPVSLRSVSTYLLYSLSSWSGFA